MAVNAVAFTVVNGILFRGPAIDGIDAVGRIATTPGGDESERMAVQLWPFRTVGWLFAICGGLALVLATVGLAGVVIYAVNRRLREFGVRLALGARPRDLMQDVVAGTARLLLPGLAVGTLVAAALARLARVAFYGVNVLNPLTYVAVALLESAIVVVACVGPALRASHIDPIVALRTD